MYIESGDGKNQPSLKKRRGSVFVGKYVFSSLGCLAESRISGSYGKCV